MNTAAEEFRKRLETAIREGRITKTELSRITGIGRPLLDSYIKGKTIPGLKAVEIIAWALGTTAAKMLETDADRPGKTPIVKEHDIQECYRRVGEAIKTSRPSA